jgi:hypothetical protein
MTMDHSKCDHPRTPAGRSKCRRANGVSTPRTKLATTRVLDLDDEKEDRPADKARCCYNCGVRKIEWKGTIPVSGMFLFTCEKCKYLIVNAPDLQAIEV